MERLGYVHLPEVKVGMVVDWGTKPFVVKDVMAPAADAGVKAGDCFLTIDGHTVTSYYQLARFLNSKHVGDEVKIELLRDEEVKVVPVVLISQ
jgi:serine protease Do